MTKEEDKKNNKRTKRTKIQKDEQIKIRESNKLTENYMDSLK